MATIVLRSVKGSALTFQEGDDNFNNLNTDKLEDITNESIGDLSDVDITSGAGISDGQTIVWDNANSKFIPGNVGSSTALENVVEDTTPQLGGTLDGQANTVQDIQLENYKETIYSLGTTDTPAIDVANGNVQTVTITSGLSLPAFTNAETGQSVTLIVSGSGTATGTANHKFAESHDGTLTTSSVISIFYDGTTYWTSIATNFA